MFQVTRPQPCRLGFPRPSEVVATRKSTIFSLTIHTHSHHAHIHMQTQQLRILYIYTCINLCECHHTLYAYDCMNTNFCTASQLPRTYRQRVRFHTQHQPYMYMSQVPRERQQRGNPLFHDSLRLYARHARGSS